MPTRRGKKKLQNGQFSYVMWQPDMGEEHKRETWSKLGTKNPKVQSKGPPQKKKKGKKRKKSVHTKTYALWKNCVSTCKRQVLHSVV